MVNLKMRNVIACAVGIGMAIASQSALCQTRTNVAELKRISIEAAARAKAEKKAAVRMAKLLGLPIRQELPGGKVRELMRFVGSVPVYYETMNLGAAKTVSADQVWPGGVMGLDLTGAGITLLEWDVGSARLTHQEFGGRATSPDGAATAEHSTHVGGTMIAAGVDPNAKGMSFQGTLLTFDWDADDSEMAAQAAAGARASNHSYGWMWYGGYESIDALRDSIAYNAPYYLICQAAGNSGPSYRTLIVPAFAKDIMVVGAVNKNPAGYSGPGSVSIAGFSSRGPTPDGRVKPDIVTPGVNLYSCYPDSDTAYGYMSGTSMATPCFTGNMGLIIEYYRRTHSDQDMLSSTLKALVIHTADEAGPANGPDYNYGWGQLNTASACGVIKESLTEPDEIQEKTLSSGETYTYTVASDGNGPLKVTLCWNDPPGPETGTTETTPLVNDLDLRVTNDETEYMPWTLDKDNPDNPAVAGDNKVDNVEQVVFQPVAGICTITVSAKNATLSPSGSQAFSLIVTGANSPGLTGFTLAPSTIAGDEVATGTVTMSLPAPSGGAVIKLTTSNKNAAMVPASVRVPVGSTSATFNVVGKVLSAPESTTITAQYGSVTFSAPLTVTPKWLVGLNLNPSTVAGGQTSQGTVTIGKAAPVGGALVTLASTDPASASVNWQVVIPEGSKTATFPVTTYPTQTPHTVYISASYPGPTLTAALYITPSVGVESVAVSPTSIAGGSGATGTVTLSQVAPAGGAVVTLGSDNPKVMVPASVTVPAGSKTKTFTVSTSTVTTAMPATISATYQSVTKTTSVQVTPSGNFSLDIPETTLIGGTSTTGTITLPVAAGSRGVVVKLASSNRKVATVPSSVTVRAGSTTATFTVKTYAVKTPTSVTITASQNGKTSKVTLTVTRN